MFAERSDVDVLRSGEGGGGGRADTGPLQVMGERGGERSAGRGANMSLIRAAGDTKVKTETVETVYKQTSASKSAATAGNQ